jgi:hypothetical protein
MSISGVEANRENKMRQLSKIYAAPAALFAVAYVAVATPAAAASNEYCRQDITSGMRSCGFETPGAMPGYVLRPWRQLLSRSNPDRHQQRLCLSTEAFAFKHNKEAGSPIKPYGGMQN